MYQTKEEKLDGVAKDLRDLGSGILDAVKTIEQLAGDLEDKSNLLERLNDLGGEDLLDQIEGLPADLDDLSVLYKAVDKTGQDADDLSEKAELYDTVLNARTDWDPEVSIIDQIIAHVKTKPIDPDARIKDILKQFAQLLEDSK